MPPLRRILLLPWFLGGGDVPARDHELPTALAPFEVTGSRLRQPTPEPLLPLARFERADLERSGHATFTEFLQALPWNSGNLNTPANAVALSAAQTTVNLRGLGANNTLLLLNGRRVPLFGQADGSTLSADIGSLPSAAIESVEVLRESASALYGSDAVAGVVNVRLRPSFSGALARVSYHQFMDTDWSRRTASLTWGLARPGISLLAVVDYAAANDVRFGDRPVSRTEDLRGVGGRDLRQNFGWPGQVLIPPDLATAPASTRGAFASPGAIAGGVVTLAGPTRTVRAGDFVRLPVNLTGGRPTPGDTQNNFDRAPATTLLPAEETSGVYFQVEHALLPAVAAFAEVGWRRRVITTSLHPTPVGTDLESGPGVGDGPGGAILFPRTNPFNPFGADLTTVRFQLVELGPRIREFTNETPRGLLGLRGRAGATWSWEAAALYAHNAVAEDTRNYILDTDVQAGLAGRAGGFLNPFGPSDPGVVDRLRTSLHARQTFRLRQADVRASGEVRNLPAGALRAALGAETRREDYRGEPSALAARGAYAAWSALNRQNAGRDIHAAFAEAAVPLPARLDARLAARAERYSDFGTTIQPTYTLTWRPLPGLAVRAARSAAFKAPELLDLYASQTESYTVVDDPRRPDLGSYAVRYRAGGNPDLQPERSIGWNLGAGWQLPGQSGLAFEATAWRLAKEGLVSSLGPTFLVRQELAPDFPTASRLVRGAPDAAGRPGLLLLINDVRGNVDRVLAAGWDLGLRWRTLRSARGELQVHAHASRLRHLRYESRTGGVLERAGANTVPEWRGQAGAAWHHSSWEAAGSVDWIGHHDGDGVNFSGGSITQHARAFVHLHFARALPREMRVMIGVSNVFDTDPPINFASNRGYTTGTYSNQGRGYSIALEKKY